MTNQSNRPLWQVMHDAFLSVNLSGGGGHKGFAAEIRAIAEKVQVEFGEYFADRDPVLLKVINWLDSEADRAEAGE